MRVQSIVGALLYYSRAVDNKLILALSDLGQQKFSSTEATNNAINQLLDYISTYPADGITFCASDMVLSGPYDAAYLNVSLVRSRAGAHIMLSEDVPVPRYNRPILTIAKIIKCVMSSFAKAELAGLYICAKEMVPLRQSLVKMGWPQPRSPIQCDNSTAIGVANEKIIPRKTKSMDIFFTGCVEEILKASSGTSGHLSSTIWVTTAPRTISQSTTSPNGRSGRLHFTTLD